MIKQSDEPSLMTKAIGADYIPLAIEDGDPGLLAAALGDVASARGMTQVA